MATIVVCGGAGFIGSHFVRYWLERHPTDWVVCYDLLTYAGNLDNLADVAARYPGRYQFEWGDIGDHGHLLQLFDQTHPSWVVNFAAESHNSRAVLDPDAFFRTNVLGTVALARAVRDAGVPRFHHVSTCEVFGDLPLDSDERFDDDAPYRPRTPYSAAKAAGDLAVRSFVATFGLPATISVCCNNYGPYQLPEKLIPHFTVRALRGETLPLYRSSANRREWLHVLDHCRAIELILTGGEVGETYNVGSGVDLDVEAIAARVLETLGLDGSLKRYVDDRPGLDRRYLLDSSKLRIRLGWAPTIDLDAGLRETVLWYRDHPEWWQRTLDRLAVQEDGWAARRPASGKQPAAGTRS